MQTDRRVAVVHNIPKMVGGRPLHATVIAPLVKALRRHGLIASEYHESRMALLISSEVPQMLHDRESVAADLVLGRTVGSTRGYALLHALALSGVPVVNNPAKARIAGDKLAAASLLRAAGLPVVPTVAIPAEKAHSPERYEDILGSGPCIVKPSSGFGGRGVRLAPSPREIVSHMGASGVWLAQPYLNSEDIRAFCVGGKLIAAMVRTRATGEHRANLRAGGAGGAAALSEQERTVAEKAAKISGLDVVGVDLLRTQDGIHVLELNPNPGLQIGDVTGVDVVDAIAGHIAARVSQHRSARKP